MKTSNEHSEQTASEYRKKANGSVDSEGLRKASERVHRMVEDYDRSSRYARRMAWVVVALANLSGWFLILGPIEIESTAGTSLGRWAALAAYCTAAVLLVVVSTVGAVRLLPDDFFEE